MFLFERKRNGSRTESRKVEFFHQYSFERGLLVRIDIEERKTLQILTTPFFGQEGAIFGFLMAFGLLCPNLTIMLLFPPIPLKAKYLIPISMGISIYFGYKDILQGNYAQLSYLYGAVVAFIWIYFFKRKHGIIEIY